MAEFKNIEDLVRVEQVVELFARGDFPNKGFLRSLEFGGRWLIWIGGTELHRFSKRALDIVGALIALILAAPLMVVTVLLIKLDSPGPILFFQTRVGRWGRKFTCYKFRSMYIDAEKRLLDLHQLNEADGPIFKIRRDPRVTRVGRVIRKLSIDELPQIFNVLKGDMSLVGPRPPLPREVVRYTLEHRRRLDAIPGITGLQQISGRSDLPFERWVALDVEYIENQSFWYDLEILLKTIPTVLGGKGAY